MTVDMSANNIEELYQATFMEDCDIILGKNHLFKSSLLLLKAWWLYESRAIAGSTILHSVPGKERRSGTRERASKKTQGQPRGIFELRALR